MDVIFLRIYDYFQSRQRSLWLGIGVIVSLAIASLFCLRLEEDISKIMPADEGLEAVNAVFDNSDLTDRIVFLIEDPASNPENLKAFAAAFADSFYRNIDSAYVEQLQIQIDESAFLEVYDELYENLPYFLDDADYDKLAARIHPDSIDRVFQGIYKSLLTPGSSFVKKFAFRDPFSLTQIPLKSLEKFQRDETFTIDDGYLRTTDGNALLFFIHPANSSKETKNNAAFISQIENYLSNLRKKHPELSITYFGGVAVAVANATQIRRDVTLTVSIAVICLFALILYFFRRRSVFFQLVVPTALGGLIALAIMALTHDSISIIAIGIGSVLLGITLDYSLHFFTHYREKGDIRGAIRDLSTSVMVSACTTAVAFLCLFIIRSEALRHLGLFAALAVLLSAIFSLIVLPHLLAGAKQSRKETWIDKLATYRTKTPRIWMWLLIPSLLFGIVLASKVAFEDDLNRINFMPEHLQIAEQKLNDVTSAAKRGIYILAQGNNVDEALLLGKTIDSQLDRLQSEGVIANYESISSFIPDRNQRAAQLAKWKAFWTQDRIDALSNHIGESEQKYGFRAGTFDGFTQFIEKSFHTDKTVFPTLMSTVFGEFVSNRNDKTTILTIARIDEGKAPAVYRAFETNEHIAIIDKGYLISRFVDILKNDFNRLVWWSFFLVFILLHATYGRFELAIITMLPIVASWMITLGVMHLFNLKFNIVNIIITTFIFGLGIDYSIFVMRGLLHEYKYGEKHLHTYKTSIILSAITTLTGIGVMIFAQHPAMRSIASISIIGILSVVLVAFFIQPIVFRWLMKNRKGSKRPFLLSLTSIGYTVGIYFSEAVTWALCLVPLALIKLVGIISKDGMRSLASRVLGGRAQLIRFIRYPFSWKIDGDLATINDGWSIQNGNSPSSLAIVHALWPKTIFDANLANGIEGKIYTSFGLVQDHPLPDWKYVTHLDSPAKEVNLNILGLPFANSIWQAPQQLIYQVNNDRPAPTRFYRRKLFENYLYKGSIIWYYMLVKVRLENDYALFDKIIPRHARIVDIGCGYGFMAYMLNFTAPQRTILGIDYDIQKIATANYGIHKSENLNFVQGDISIMKIPPAEVYILADILHYLPPAEQKEVFHRIASQLNPQGKIIIRDGDSEVSDKHDNTKWTEVLSTGLGFNKTKTKLTFLSSSILHAWARSCHLHMEVVERSANTSNTVWVFTRIRK